MAAVRGWRVPLHGPDRVPIVRRDVVALSIDIKEYIHIVSERVLRRVHVRVAEARVMRAWMLLIQHSGVMAHPPGLVCANFHRDAVDLFSLCSCTARPGITVQKERKKVSPKSV